MKSALRFINKNILKHSIRVSNVSGWKISSKCVDVKNDLMGYAFDSFYVQNFFDVESVEEVILLI
jgi:hypothetical protein